MGVYTVQTGFENDRTEGFMDLYTMERLKGGNAQAGTTETSPWGMKSKRNTWARVPTSSVRGTSLSGDGSPGIYCIVLRDTLHSTRYPRTEHVRTLPRFGILLRQQLPRV